MVLKTRSQSSTQQGCGREMEEKEWKWDSAGAGAPRLCPMGLAGSMRGWWAFDQCFPREWRHSLPRVSFNAETPTRDVAEKHGKNQNSRSVKVLSDLIIPFYSACRKGSSWRLIIPGKMYLLSMWMNLTGNMESHIRSWISRLSFLKCNVKSCENLECHGIWK